MNYTRKIEEIEQQIQFFLEEEKKIFASTSCQTNSVVLLHIISQLKSDISVYFINTGFLFAETLIYKKQLESFLSIEIKEIKPTVSKVKQLNAQNMLLYTSTPDECCHINKVMPLDIVKQQNDVWISGVRASQTKNRANFKVVDTSNSVLTRYHPILEFSNKMVYDYIQHFNLPMHPLEQKGYVSMGCVPCTQKYSVAGTENRGGRWEGLNKTECGLHI